MTPTAAHEYGHGVTQYTSGLVYERESGALNEAFSDCMGAFADRVVLGKSPTQVWQIAEDVDLQFGVGIRSMADPTLFGNPDHFADRYLGPNDNGGVHSNSGIMNKGKPTSVLRQ
jgi:thermolysin